MTGHILYKAGLVKNQDVRKNAKDAEIYKKAGFEFAFIMDETDEERERGVTIELTTRYFNTKNRNFTILDAPGHREFVSNMITGAAQANCGILVLDSKKSAFEAGWLAF
jgi:translation elongation factor EF-1alpha